MKLAVSLVFFMLIRHVLSAPSHPPPSSDPSQTRPTPQAQAPIVAPQPKHLKHLDVRGLEEQVKPIQKPSGPFHGCSAPGCAHIEVGSFDEHLSSTHFTQGLGKRKSLTISVLLSDDLEFL